MGMRDLEVCCLAKDRGNSTSYLRKHFGGIIQNMERIHISEADASANFEGLMARARAGAEIFIEKPALPDVVLRVADRPSGRLFSESIALAEAHAGETGDEPVMDADFAADLEEILRNRKPRDTSAWD
jgi:hypothetical protein